MGNDREAGRYPCFFTVGMARRSDDHGTADCVHLVGAALPGQRSSGSSERQSPEDETRELVHQRAFDRAADLWTAQRGRSRRSVQRRSSDRGSSTRSPHHLIGAVSAYSNWTTARRTIPGRNTTTARAAPTFERSVCAIERERSIVRLCLLVPSQYRPAIRQIGYCDRPDHSPRISDVFAAATADNVGRHRPMLHCGAWRDDHHVRGYWRSRVWRRRWVGPRGTTQRPFSCRDGRRGQPLHCRRE